MYTQSSGDTVGFFKYNKATAVAVWYCAMKEQLLKKLLLKSCVKNARLFTRGPSQFSMWNKWIKKTTDINIPGGKIYACYTWM